MVKAVDEIARVADDNAAATEQVSAAAEEQLAAMQDMALATNELAKLAEELLVVVGASRLDTANRIRHHPATARISPVHAAGAWFCRQPAAGGRGGQPPHTWPIPGSPLRYVGAMNFHDTIVAVMDMAAFLGLPSSTTWKR